MSDREFEILASAFGDLLPPDASVDKLAGGFRFLEGPVWSTAAGGLLFSDIPADRLWLWPETGGARVWREPSHHANGNTLDNRGRLLTCEHGTRRVTRTEADGRTTVLAERYRGRRLNSPNDIAVRADDSIWFTDPPYGIDPEQAELPGHYVFRLGPDGDLRVVADDLVKPNGICFAPDQHMLYISDTDDERRHLRRFEVAANGKLHASSVLATVTPGKADGFRVDCEGRIFTSAGDGIQVLSPDGALLGKILVPETPSNCAFGGVDLQTLYITARSSLYAVRLATAGIGNGSQAPDRRVPMMDGT